MIFRIVNLKIQHRMITLFRLSHNFNANIQIALQNQLQSLG